MTSPNPPSKDRTSVVCALARRVRNQAPLLCALALLHGYAGAALADNGKVDGWCSVIEKNIERNEEDARRAHDSGQSDRLREARRKLEKDAHDRGCPGH